jgi:hypothetical protein
MNPSLRIALPVRLPATTDTGRIRFGAGIRLPTSR